MNARLRAARILLVVYAHHVTSKSHDVRIYARVVHFNMSDHNTTRKRETIRHNKSESYWMKYLETGSEDSVRNMDRRFRECRNRQNGAEVCKDVWSVGNWVAEVGHEYFCLDYVSKNGVSVMECNNFSNFKIWALLNYSNQYNTSQPTLLIDIAAVCIIQGMRLFILKKNKCLVNSISPSILHGMIWIYFCHTPSKIG